MYDVLIYGGAVLDGTGAAACRCDVAVQEGKIAAVGDLTGREARLVIHAAGKAVTPGFIDIHRHADVAVFRPGFGELELAQGLTTIVNGNCGLGAAPFGKKHSREIRTYLAPILGAPEKDVPAESMAAYLGAMKELPIHVGMLAPNGILRADVAGYEKVRLDEEDFAAVHKSMEKALAEGALGVSLGLGYAPECFYTTEELIRALEPLRGTDVPVTVHMRQEGGGVVESVAEMMTVARTLRCPVHISHLKAMGRDNWRKKIPAALKLLTEAREEGLDVGCDAYPYTAGSTQLLHILPPEFLAGGMEGVVHRLQDKTARRELAGRIESGEGFDNIAGLAGWDGIYLTSLQDGRYLGKSIAEIARMRGQSPVDACCDLLVQERGQITMIDFMAAEEDIASVLKNPLSSVVSDSTYPTEGNPHPRVYGTFARVIQHFVVEKKELTLPKAVEKMTSAPAKALRLRGKGIIAPGMDADLCVFSPENVEEMGTYTQPKQLAQGMDTVLVAGQVAWERGQMTACRAGKVVKRDA